jgi:hypothetical protein
MLDLGHRLTYSLPTAEENLAAAFSRRDDTIANAPIV